MNLCKDCIYFNRCKPTKSFWSKKKTPSTKGECWRLPPMLVVYGRIFPIFDNPDHPLVDETDYCGEFTAMRKEK